MLKKTIHKFFLFVLTSFVFISCSEEKQNKIFEFYTSHPSYSAVNDFSGFKIEKRGGDYLLGFPNFNKWLVYEFDEESHSISLIRNSQTNSILSTKEAPEDSLREIAKRKLVLFTKYNIIQIDGTLDSNQVIEFSFSANDVLSYINTKDSTNTRRAEYIKTNATKLCEEVYYLKREVPLDLADY